MTVSSGSSSGNFDVSSFDAEAASRHAEAAARVAADHAALNAEIALRKSFDDVRAGRSTVVPN